MTPLLKSRGQKDLASAFQSQENSVSSPAWQSPVLWIDRGEVNCSESCSLSVTSVSWGWLGVAEGRRWGDSTHRMFTRRTAFFKRRPLPPIMLAIQTTWKVATILHHSPPGPQLLMQVLPRNLAPAPKDRHLPVCDSNEVTSRNVLITRGHHCYMRGLNKSPQIWTCGDFQ